MSTALFTTLGIGLVVASAGVLVMPHGRLPFWVMPTATMAAVLLGALVVRMAGLGAGQFSAGPLVVQVVFGCCAVVLIVAAADRRPVESPGRANGQR